MGPFISLLNALMDKWLSAACFCRARVFDSRGGKFFDIQEISRTLSILNIGPQNIYQHLSMCQEMCYQ